MTSRSAVILVALLAAACGRSDVLSHEASQAKLVQHRKAYEWLAAEVRACGLDRLKAVGPGQCKGGTDTKRLQTAMQTLAVLEVGLDGGDVWLMTGADGTRGQSMAAPVASLMINTRDTDRLPGPLTPSPSHWFYRAHD